MGTAYRVGDQENMHFITCTVHQWADVFTRKDYIEILLESLWFCQQKKGLEIYAWVVMTNHIHLIVRSNAGKLSDTIRDFKKFTATKLLEAIENNPKESRKRWLLWLLQSNPTTTNSASKKWFWEEGFHSEEITSSNFYESKVRYIHLNPVRAGLVEKEEEYNWSSCGDFYGTRKGWLELALV